MTVVKRDLIRILRQSLQRPLTVGIIVGEALRIATKDRWKH